MCQGSTTWPSCLLCGTANEIERFILRPREAVKQCVNLFPIRPYRCAVGDRLLLFREAGGDIYGPYERRTEEDG